MIIDRIENKIVICEDENGKMIELSVDIFVQPIQDGDIVIRNENGLYEVDKVETQKRMKNIENRYNNLFK